MGDMYLELLIANPQHPEQQQVVDFLIDTGATRTWILQELADILGLIPLRTLELTLADGSVKEFPAAPCLVDFGGEREVMTVVIGPPGSEPLVGNQLLQNFRLVVDLDTHTIARSQAPRAR
jgi:clan AA aspartic protease